MSECWDLTEGLAEEPVAPPEAVVWRPAPDGPITAHFDWDEARCHHCGRISSVEAVQNTARWLEKVRHDLFDDRPIRISSWCRCPVWNERVGGATNSYHLKGWAIDFTVSGLTVPATQQILQANQGEPGLIRGLGLYGKWSHCDRGPVRTWHGP